METVQLFLSINKPGLDNEWNSGITAALKQLPSIELVQVIEENEKPDASLTIRYDMQKITFSEIEKIVNDSGAVITKINIHFPSGITGVTDPYAAAAVSLKFEEKLKKIEGVLGSTISSGGKLKVEIDTLISNKQKIITEIIKSIANC